MSGINPKSPVLNSTLSCEVDERSPAFENHCQYNCPSLIIKNGCEDSSSGICYEGPKPYFEQSSNSGADSLEEKECVVTAHFVSNGYYGFQPLTLAMMTEVDCQMDVGDLNAVEGAEGSSCHETIANGTSFEPYRWQSQLIRNKSPQKGFTVLGKRNWDGVTEIHTEVKRIRQEEWCMILGGGSHSRRQQPITQVAHLVNSIIPPGVVFGLVVGIIKLSYQHIISHIYVLVQGMGIYLTIVGNKVKSEGKI